MTPKDYGFNYEPSDLYSLEPCKEVLVDTVVTDLVGFAKSFNISDLSIFNMIV